jgi:hypothetical protein
MRKILLVSSATILTVVALTAVALAQKSGAHLNEDPVCTLSADGSTITCTGGTAAGLGNQPVTVSASAPAGCETKPGNNQPAGHAQESSEPIQPRGGRIDFPDFTLTADCPPGLNTVLGTTVTYTILTTDGVLVFTFTVTAT